MHQMIEWYQKYRQTMLPIFQNDEDELDGTVLKAGNRLAPPLPSATFCAMISACNRNKFSDLPFHLYADLLLFQTPMTPAVSAALTKACLQISAKKRSSLANDYLALLDERLIYTSQTTRSAISPELFDVEAHIVLIDAASSMEHLRRYARAMDSLTHRSKERVGNPLPNAVTCALIRSYVRIGEVGAAFALFHKLSFHGLWLGAFTRELLRCLSEFSPQKLRAVENVWAEFLAARLKPSEKDVRAMIKVFRWQLRTMSVKNAGDLNRVREQFEGYYQQIRSLAQRFDFKIPKRTQDSLQLLSVEFETAAMGK